MESQGRPTFFLTEQQHNIQQNAGQRPARALDPVTREEYVLIPAAVYDRLAGMLPAGDDWANASMHAAAEVFARDGWNDSQMHLYNDAWSAEIEARASAFDRGEIPARDAREVIEEIRQELRSGDRNERLANDVDPPAQ